MKAELSATLARHVAATRYEDLSPRTIAAAKRAFIDALGVMLAASGMSDDVQPFVATARAMQGPREASILGHWDRVGAVAAALANGAMAHALDYEDAFDAAPTHPNASLIPALLAIAQSQDGVSGAELIVALAVGCDISCRLALSVGDALEASAWYPPPILGAFGAVAGAARLRGLTPSQITDAFSLMLCQTACPGEIKHSDTSVIRAVREAFPAQAAVVATMLAAQGVRGFDAPFEGRAGFYRLFANGRCDADALLHELGHRYYVEELSFKPWPCCRGTHACIEAAQALRDAHGIRWQEIKSIAVLVGPVQQMLCEPIARKRAPTTVIDAKFSIPFTVAAAFTQAEVTLDSFAPRELGNPDVLALAQRVEATVRPRGSASGGAVSVELVDGRHYQHDIEQPLGHPARPLDEQRLRAKFIDCAARAARPWSQQEAGAACGRLLGLDSARDITTTLEFPEA